MQNPQDIAKKWSTNLSNAKASIKAGIQAVTVSPTSKAAAAVDAYKAGCQRAADSGAFVNGCNKVTLQQWKDKTINKGLANLDNGLKDGETNMAAFQQKARPFYEAASQAAANVTGTGRTAAMAKMNAVWDAMDDLKTSLQGS